MSRSLFVCAVMVQGPWEARSYIAAHDRTGLADDRLLKCKLRVITRMLPFNVLAKTACWPPMSRIHCHLVKPALETKPKENNPWGVLPNNVAGQQRQERPQQWANSNQRRDSRLGRHGRACPPFPSSSSTLPSNEQERSATLSSRP